MITTIMAAACTGSGYYSTCLPKIGADGSSLKTALQIVFGILAALTVLMVMIGALRLSTSEGNPENTKQARGTIVFALIGLAIALSAEAIVSFVLGRS